MGILGQILIDRDESTRNDITEELDTDEEGGNFETKEFQKDKPTTSHQEYRCHERIFRQTRYPEGIPTKDLIRTIRPISGEDDLGTGDFIKIVSRIEMQCAQPQLLLDFILAEKITG